MGKQILRKGRKPVDLTGQKFCRLVVSDREFVKNRRGHLVLMWSCLCVCGAITLATTRQLMIGGKRSCGCLKKEKLSAEKTTHGMSGSKIYRVWYNMIRRCYEVGHRVYKDYGGRGITVCDRWRFSFEDFYKDMGDKPPRMTLERVNVDGDYEPSNCVWATQKEQTRNQRRTIKINLHGEVFSLASICEERGLKYSKIRARLMEYGWDAERAVGTP